MYFPDVLEQIGLPGRQIEEFVRDITEKGTVLIPEIIISINDEDRVYSLLSTRTKTILLRTLTVSRDNLLTVLPSSICVRNVKIYSMKNT